MRKSTRLIGSLTLALGGLLGSGVASAQGTWDLDACVTGTSGACSSGGSTVTVTGIYANGGAWSVGSLNFDSGWVGVNSKNGSNTSESTGSPNHAIDNYTGSGSSTLGASYEGVYLNFTKAVDLTSIAAVWVYDDNGSSSGGTAGHGDFQVWRWVDGTTTPGSITGTSVASMSGWVSVTTTNGNFASSLSQSITDGTLYSSHWLVTTKFGGSDDAFKLGTVVSTTKICTTSVSSTGACNPTPGSGVPEPMSLALFGVAALGAGFARRRAKASLVA